MGRVDVGTDAALQPRRDASAQTEGKPESKANQQANITDLEHGLLKGVLQFLDCSELFRARRGERHMPRPVLLRHRVLVFRPVLQRQQTVGKRYSLGPSLTHACHGLGRDHGRVRIELPGSPSSRC